MEVPQAKDAMDKFKMEVAGELGVSLKNGYNGDLTSAEAGSIGGELEIGAGATLTNASDTSRRCGL